MNCPWFENNIFYISSPGFVAPCCFFPFIKMLPLSKNLEFQEKYKMLYLKNNTLDNILFDKKILEELIRELTQTKYCEKYCGKNYINDNSKQYDFQIMLTTKCSLNCLACLRNDMYYKKEILKYDWDFDFDLFKKHFNKDILKSTRSIQFTGSIGDAIFYNRLLLLLLYILSCNNKIHISIHTNGCYRSIKWWNMLATLLKKFEQHVVVFSIDGLKNTYNIYRVNGDFNQVITNATSFIQKGGNAHWKFIQMKHNEMDIEEAKKLSKELGFSLFTISKPWKIKTASSIYNENL
jgi:MoaA/NifB/PqqE/SkfB family radical SAM enzyme